MNSQPEELSFQETQYMRRVWWIMLLVYGIAALMWYGFIIQIFFGAPFGTNPAPDWAMWLLWLIFGIGLPLFFHKIKLIVEVKWDGIHIRYLPFIARTIPFSQIEDFQARTYSPIKEYGGWGIKGWSRKRIAYNVSGNQGVELTLTGGRQVMIGSQKAQELAKAIAAKII